MVQQVKVFSFKFEFYFMDCNNFEKKYEFIFFYYYLVIKF